MSLIFYLAARYGRREELCGYIIEGYFDAEGESLAAQLAELANA